MEIVALFCDIDDFCLQFEPAGTSDWGGWELRIGKDLVPQETKQQMIERTSWGNLITNQEQTQDLDAAASGTESERGWWRWRWWRPKW